MTSFSNLQFFCSSCLKEASSVSSYEEVPFRTKPFKNCDMTLSRDPFSLRPLSPSDVLFDNLLVNISLPAELSLLRLPHLRQQLHRADDVPGRQRLVL